MVDLCHTTHARKGEAMTAPLAVSHWVPQPGPFAVDVTVGDAVRDAAARWADRVALIEGTAAGSPRRWTFADLLASSEQVAHAAAALCTGRARGGLGGQPARVDAGPVWRRTGRDRPGNRQSCLRARRGRVRAAPVARGGPPGGGHRARARPAIPRDAAPEDAARPARCRRAQRLGDVPRGGRQGVRSPTG
jgi:hypothetical protein